jgi:hypothetical protein
MKRAMHNSHHHSAALPRLGRVFASLLAGAVLTLAISPSASASTPAEKVVCTTAAPATWLPEHTVRDQFTTADYALVKFKISRGGCYEVYAIARDHSVVEAYYNPTTAQAMRITRVALPLGTMAAQQR